MEINRLRIEIQKPNESRIHSRSALLQHANARAQFWQFKTSSIQQTTNNGEWCVQNTEHIPFHDFMYADYITEGKHISSTLSATPSTRVYIYLYGFFFIAQRILRIVKVDRYAILHACVSLSVCIVNIYRMRTLSNSFSFKLSACIRLFRSFVRSFVWFCCCFNVCMCAFSVYFSLIFFK